MFACNVLTLLPKCLNGDTASGDSSKTNGIIPSWRTPHGTLCRMQCSDCSDPPLMMLPALSPINSMVCTMYHKPQLPVRYMCCDCLNQNDPARRTVMTNFQRSCMMGDTNPARYDILHACMVNNEWSPEPLCSEQVCSGVAA